MEWISKQHLGVIGLFAFILAEIWFAAYGLMTFFGMLTPVILLVSFILRWGLTFVIGTFMYAYFVQEWQWGYSTLFSAPAVVLMLPKMLPNVVEVFANWRARSESVATDG